MIVKPSKEWFEHHDLVLQELAKLYTKQTRNNNIQNQGVNMLSEALRDELKNILAADRRDGCFGGGMEDEYIWSGCNMVGLNDMSDEDLIAEYEGYADEDDEFLTKLKVEMEAHKMVAEPPITRPLIVTVADKKQIHFQTEVEVEEGKEGGLVRLIASTLDQLVEDEES